MASNTLTASRALALQSGWPQVRTTAAAVTIEAAGLGALVGWDGSLGWRLARLLAVLGGASVALWAVAHSRYPLARVELTAYAIVGMVAGGGLAAAYLLRGVLAPLGLAGLVTLLSSATVFWSQRHVLLRRSRGARIAVKTVGILALSVLLWTFVPAVMATNAPPIDLGATPATVGLDYRDVTFRTSDGVRLSGWYVEGSNGAGVVLRHGAASTRSALLDHAVVLSAAGYSVLMTDARGRGESQGRPMDFGWYGDLDVTAAVDFLAKQDGVDPTRIALFGRSMGGEEAIGAAASDKRIAAVVAEGATGRSAADKEWLVEQFGWRGSLQLQLDRASDWLVDTLTEAAPPTPLRTAVVESGVPMLLIAAADVSAEQDVAEVLAAGQPQVRTWVAPGGHTAGLRIAREEWTKRVLSFLDASLVLAN